MVRIIAPFANDGKDDFRLLDKLGLVILILLKETIMIFGIVVLLKTKFFKASEYYRSC